MSLLANSNAIETGGYQISRSVRLRSSANGNFTRTPSSATNRRTWTWSAWVKRGLLSSGEQVLFSAGSSYTAQTYFTFYIGSDNKLVTSTGTAEIWRTTQVFRDPSAWYHVVLVVDTTQATADNRTRLYVNGAEVTSFTRGTNLSPNTDYGINYNIIHYIGRDWFQPIYFDGYLTEINFIDGQALTPSSFGETDTITGSWVAKKFTGTYGTNGFYLNFSDNSNNTSTTIGKDYSGNGNNWTPNNISVTAGSTYDSMLDVPSGNGYADGGNGRGNYATLNPLENTGNTLSAANLTATSGSNWYNTKSTIGMLSGKWYCEFVHTTAVNYTQVGVFKTESPLSTSTYFSVSANGWSYSAAFGELRNNDVSTTSGISTSAVGDIINIAVDVDAGKLWFGKNGTWFNSGNPASGTNAAYTNLSGGMSFVVGTNSTAVINANFGQRPFSYTPPTGFKALNTTNLSDPTIKKGSSYFDVVTRAGTAATANITSLSFQPDFVWFKSRGRAVDHALYDSVRGVEKRLETNNTDAEVTGDTTGLTAFNSNGYTIGALDQINGTTATNSFVDWAWKANGTGVSNTAGTITSTVSANTTSGFSIVTYTGTGANATVGHGLGVAPSMIMVKRRNSTGSWDVYHVSVGNTKALFLNQTASQNTDIGYWNNTSPTSTVFTVGIGTEVNQNTGTYVAYCFAAVPGYSAFGSYSGSADLPFVYCGFRPRWVLIKATTGSNNWIIYDTVRNTYNLTNLSLVPDSSALENGISSTIENTLDILSNGFKLRTSNALTNGSSVPYIYAAFAENPLKFSNAR